MTWALGGLLRVGLGRDGAEDVRPHRGPGRQWVRLAWERQHCELGEQSWACQDLNLGPHPYQQSTGNRCANRRFRRSRSTVGVKVKWPNGLKLSALATRPESH